MVVAVQVMVEKVVELVLGVVKVMDLMVPPEENYMVVVVVTLIAVLETLLKVAVVEEQDGMVEVVDQNT